MKNIIQLQTEAAKWKARNEQYREWLLKHPHVIGEERWHGGINEVDALKAELEEDMKKQPSARQLPLRTRLKLLLISTIALMKEDRKKGVEWHGRTV
ncbi:hypothetical protein [Paenibacillus daejeonensis]|uniref:hypothetical protein n=1 Tax=Paenibacillus daejeonensis TaxID=135193 RepID=UPI000364E194|nr:hypothetical protein [Paenibacillus daejeonensis]